MLAQPMRAIFRPVFGAASRTCSKGNGNDPRTFRRISLRGLHCGWRHAPYWSVPRRSFGRATVLAGDGDPANRPLPVTAGGTLPGNPAIQLVQVAGGLVDPINIANAGDGSGRLFVVERIGRIRIIDKDGKLLEQPFLDIQDAVKTDFLEQGLLGVAFQPELQGERPLLRLLRRLHHQRQSLPRAVQGVGRRPEQG